MAEKNDTDRFLKKLAAACDGLLYVSETDAAVEPVAFPASENTPRRDLIKTLLDAGSGSKISKFDPAEFFGRLTAKRDWHGEKEQERAAGFRRLMELLESELSHLTVYRVGKIRIEIFVLGRTRGGTVAGVRTRAVET